MSAKHKTWVDAVDTGFETLFFISVAALVLAVLLGGLESEFSAVVAVAAITTVVITAVRMIFDL